MKTFFIRFGITLIVMAAWASTAPCPPLAKYTLVTLGTCLLLVGVALNLAQAPLPTLATQPATPRPAVPFGDVLPSTAIASANTDGSVAQSSYPTTTAMQPVDAPFDASVAIAQWLVTKQIQCSAVSYYPDQGFFIALLASRRGILLANTNHDLTDMAIYLYPLEKIKAFEYGYVFGKATTVLTGSSVRFGNNQRVGWRSDLSPVSYDDYFYIRFLACEGAPTVLFKEPGECIKWARRIESLFI